MRLLKLSVPLAILALAAAACDGDNTPGIAVESSDSANDPNAGVATQPAGNTATQPAGNTATQPAGNTATQPAGNTATQTADNTATQPTSAGGNAVTVQYCTSVCNHVAALACADDEEEATDCASDCANVGMLPETCKAALKDVLGCAARAASCATLDGCTARSEAFADCVDGESVTPTPTPTTPTISDPANCNVASTCMGCESTCDACVCAAQLGGYSAAAITASCGTLCSSSG